MKKIIIWLLIIILIGGSIWAVYYFINRNSQTTTSEILRSEPIEFGNLAQTVSASGNLVYQESVDLYFRTTGPVSSINVKSGDTVKQDQILATLNTADLQRAHQQAELALEKAELNLQTALEPPAADNVNLAKNAVNSAAQALEAARLGKQASQADANSLIVQAERERESAYITLRDASDGKKETAQRSFDTAVQQEAIARLNANLLIQQAESQWWSAYQRYKQAERSLELLQSPPNTDTIKQLELLVRQAEVNLDQAQDRYSDASIIAPFDGIITQINLQSGVEPNSIQPAIKLVDKSQYYIKILIDEIDIGKVEVGMPATIQLDAYPITPINGQVESIAPSYSNLGGIVSYEVSVRITEFGEMELREGMTASVEIIVDTVANVLLIPNWAIKTDQETGETYCYRIIDDIPNKTTIRLGILGDTYSIVTSGLGAGDIVGLISEDRNLLNQNFRPGQGMQP